MISRNLPKAGITEVPGCWQVPNPGMLGRLARWNQPFPRPTLVSSRSAIETRTRPAPY